MRDALTGEVAQIALESGFDDGASLALNATSRLVLAPGRGPLAPAPVLAQKRAAPASPAPPPPPAKRPAVPAAAPPGEETWAAPRAIAASYLSSTPAPRNEAERLCVRVATDLLARAESAEGQGESRQRFLHALDRLAAEAP